MAIDYYSKTGCKVGETDNYDSNTGIHHCLGIAVNPTDADEKYAKEAMIKFVKETNEAQLNMDKLVKEAEKAQEIANKKAQTAKTAIKEALAMMKALASYYTVSK